MVCGSLMLRKKLRLRLMWAEQIPQASDPGETNSSAQHEPSEMTCMVLIATIRHWGEPGGGQPEGAARSSGALQNSIWEALTLGRALILELEPKWLLPGSGAPLPCVLTLAGHC